MHWSPGTPLYLFVVVIMVLFSTAAMPTFAGPMEVKATTTSSVNCTGELDFDCGPFEQEPTRCISSLWVCDNIADCESKKDEYLCTYLIKCWPGEFMCRDSNCISGNLKCNGHEDCPDGSDERGCSEAITIKGHQINAVSTRRQASSIIGNELLDHRQEKQKNPSLLSETPSGQDLDQIQKKDASSIKTSGIGEAAVSFAFFNAVNNPWLLLIVLLLPAGRSLLTSTINGTAVVFRL